MFPNLVIRSMSIVLPLMKHLLLIINYFVERKHGSIAVSIMSLFASLLIPGLLMGSDKRSIYKNFHLTFTSVSSYMIYTRPLVDYISSRLELV